MEIRCPSKLHGIMIAPDVIEVACSSRFCGAGNGYTARHQYSTVTGELLDTDFYMNPPRPVGEKV